MHKPSQLSFLILCRNGASCDADHGEAGLTGYKTGAASEPVRVLSPDAPCRGSFRPARSDLRIERSGNDDDTLLKKDLKFLEGFTYIEFY